MIAPSCCGTCRHWLPDVTDDRESEATTGWCKRNIPGEWLGFKQHKWKDGTGGVMCHAEGCCTDHADKPDSTGQSQPSD
jgi:hypothetical protein